jgi:hypothetical protein
MKLSIRLLAPRILAPICGALIAASSAHAQVYKLHGAEISGGAVGQITTPLPAMNSSSIETNTNDSFGGFFSLRDNPVPWAGLEFNYSYTEYSQFYTAYNGGNIPYTATVHNDVHEATAAYIVHPKYKFLHPLRSEPFISLGGGYLDFVPTGAGSNQWRGTGLVEVGFDIPTSNPHMGFKVEGRELIYRQPDFNQPDLASRTWVATAEPAFGVYYRW